MKWALGGLALLGIVAGAMIWPVTKATAQGDVARAHFINVGKGDASLLEFPCGAVLVDAGGGENSEGDLTRYLDQFFASRPDLNNTLSLVVLTHGHLDHTRNIGAVLKRYQVTALMMNGHFKKRGHKGLRKLLRKSPQTKLILADTENIPTGGLWDPTIDTLDCDGKTGGQYPDIRLIWGDARPRLPGWKERHFKDENNHSVSVMVRWGQSKTLLTGDLEARGIKEMQSHQSALLQDVDLYHISHHGFRSGTAKGFLEHIRPRVAILSRPADRAWFEPTMDRFNRLVRGTRTAITVPVWNFAVDGDNRGEDGFSEEQKKHSKRSRPERDGTLSGAIYWTGIDGSIRVDLGANSDVSVVTRYMPLQ